MLVSAKRQKSPLVLSPEQVKSGLTELQFRDQLSVFLIGALGTRRGEVGGLRWMDCDFANEAFSLLRPAFVLPEKGQASERDEDGSIRKTFADAFRAQGCAGGMARPERLHSADGLCVSFFTQEGAEAARSWRGTQSEDQARVCQDRNHWSGLAYIPTYSRGDDADMGEHQLTIRDYLRHSYINVTNQYLQATAKSKRLAQDKLVDAILPTGSLSQSKPSLIQ